MSLLGVLGVILVVLACIQLIWAPVAVSVGVAVVAALVGLALIFFNYRGTGRI
jgi:hypothetical protein